MPNFIETTVKEMVNVGVTAKLASPLHNISGVLHSSSTTTTESEHRSLQKQYQQFLNEKTSTLSEDTLSTFRDLYQLKTGSGEPKVTPSKIEFLLYQKDPHQKKKKSKKVVRLKKSHSSIKQLLESESKSEDLRQQTSSTNTQKQDVSFVERLRKKLQKKKIKKTPKKPKPPKEPRIDIYPFDHGCAEYLRTTDFAPQLISELLAQRATDYATRFWAEVFGSLHIGVTFALSFFLQTYRFALHTLIKSTLVGFLQMTSDYGLKPILAVVFNGFIQPLLIFLHNVLSSVRDVLKPVAETIDLFLRPVGRLLRSVRLVSFKDSRSRKKLVDV